MKNVKSFEIHAHVLKLIVQMYYDRKIYIRGKNSTMLGPRIITARIPQGPVMTPIISNICTPRLHTPIENATIIQYADDIAVYTSIPKFVAIDFTAPKCRKFLNIMC